MRERLAICIKLNTLLQTTLLKTLLRQGPTEEIIPRKILDKNFVPRGVCLWYKM